MPILKIKIICIFAPNYILRGGNVRDITGKIIPRDHYTVSYPRVVR